MFALLLDAILTPKASQGRPQSLPEGSKMHPKTGKDRCEKTSRFQAGFCHCFGEVLGSFFDEFSKRNHTQSVKNDNPKNAMKHWPWRQNQGLALITKIKNQRKNRKISDVFCASILSRFGMGFGGALGGPKR